MPTKTGWGTEAHNFRTELHKHDHDLEELPGWLFQGFLLYQADSDYSELNCASISEGQKILEFRRRQVCNIARFAGAKFAEDITNENITHIVVGNDKVSRGLREKISRSDVMNNSS